MALSRLPFLLLIYLKPHRKKVIFSAALLLAANSATLLGPLLFKEIVDHLDHSGTEWLGVTDILWLLLAAYAVARFSVALLSELRELIFAPAIRGVLQTVQENLYEHLLSLPMSYHRTRETGALTQIMRQGVAGLQAITSHAVYSVIPTVLELTLGIVLLAWRYPLPIAGSVALGVLLYLLYTRPMTRVLATQRQHINQLDAKAHQMGYEMLLHVELVQSTEGQSHELSRLRGVFDEHRKALLRSARWTSLLNLGQQGIMIACTTSSLALAIAGHRNGDLSTGDVVLVLALVIQAFTPLSILGGVYQEIRHALVDLEAVMKMLIERNAEHLQSKCASCTKTAPPSPRTAVRGQTPPGIILKDIGAYLDHNLGLTNVSLNIPAGKLTAIVGPSGSGKTTLARLICGQIKPDQGQLRFAMTAAEPIDESSVHSLVGVMPSAIPLFSISIEANIRYPTSTGLPTNGSPDFTLATERAGLHEWVNTLPDGYATLLEESGGSLSAGEKQRIGLARLLLRATPIMILDEPTSALDPDMDRRVLNALYECRGKHTIIVIAHRLSSITQADLIAVMDAGRLVDHGTHDELLARCPLYQRMWKAQLF